MFLLLNNMLIPIHRLIWICYVFQIVIGQENDGRIVGGRSVTIEDFPYQLSLEYKGLHICGAALVSKLNALTAAHCLQNIHDTKSYLIRAGTSTQKTGGVEFPIRRMAIHPNFDTSTKDYDIAVIEFKQHANYSSTIKPIELANSVPTVSKGTVSGWGALGEGASTSYQLQAVTVPIVSKFMCKLRYKNMLTDRMFCAGNFLTGGQDSCQGDSGGPFAVNNKLVGIVSWGSGCARATYPGVYASVPEVMPFIEKYVTPDK